jgi:serine/threonine protein kinase
MLQKKVISTDYIIPDYFSEEVTDLLSKILKRDPLDRLNIQQIMQHPWLQKSDALIQPSLPSRNIQQEQETAHLLLRIGFDNSVVERMKQNNVGMLGTLWTMLLSNLV